METAISMYMYVFDILGEEHRRHLDRDFETNPIVQVTRARNKRKPSNNISSYMKMKTKNLHKTIAQPSYRNHIKPGWWRGIPAILVPWCENHRFWHRKYRLFSTIGTTKTKVWCCKYWVIALEGHLGIWVAKWSVLGGPPNMPEARVRRWRASHAKEILISWHQLGRLADILAPA